LLRVKALIRRLSARRDARLVTVICSDKTGTLTENRMTVTVLDLAGHRLDVPEVLSRRMPATTIDEAGASSIKQEPSLALLLMGGALCNDACCSRSDGTRARCVPWAIPPRERSSSRRPTLWLLKERLDAAFPRVGEVPFDSDRKRMSNQSTESPTGGMWIGGLAPTSRQARRWSSQGRRRLLARGVLDGLDERRCRNLSMPAFRWRINRANVRPRPGRHAGRSACVPPPEGIADRRGAATRRARPHVRGARRQCWIRRGPRS